MRDSPAVTPGMQEWIAAQLAEETLCASQLVMGIFVDALGEAGKPVWLADLMALLAPFGVRERALRTTVYRLVEQGWLVAARSGRRSAYAIAPTAFGIAESERALLRTASPTSWNGEWSLVMPWDGKLAAGEVASLRCWLLAQGYRAIQPGVFGKPGGDAAALERRCALLGLSDKLAILPCPKLRGIGVRALRERVAHLWELDAQAACYARLCADLQALGELLAQPVCAPDPLQCFVLATLVRVALRRARRGDPQLPKALMPQDWPGDLACSLATRLIDSIALDAVRHVASLH
jgi:phenylacetic acid degradation operon negative regulatory protein